MKTDIIKNTCITLKSNITNMGCGPSQDDFDKHRKEYITDYNKNITKFDDINSRFINVDKSFADLVDGHNDLLDVMNNFKDNRIDQIEALKTKDNAGEITQIKADYEQIKDHLNKIDMFLGKMLQLRIVQIEPPETIKSRRIKLNG